MTAGEPLLCTKSYSGHQPLVEEGRSLEEHSSGNSPSSEEISGLRAFSAKRQAVMLLSLNPDSCIPGVIAACGSNQQCATGRKQETNVPRRMRHEYLASFMGELRGPHGQNWQPRRKACAAWIKQIEDIGSNGNNENGQSGPHNPQEGEPHRGCCQKYGLGLHNTANHPLCTQVGTQEAIIKDSVMLIMEQHQSTSTRPAALRHTAEHRTYTTRRRRNPAKQKHRERNLEEEKGAEPGEKDK